MAQYRVRLIRTQEFTITVEAEDEDSALDKAYAEAPAMGAMESGWEQKWGIDATEWQNVEDFHFQDYTLERHGETVVEVTG